MAIGYLCHDFDDAVRAGMISADDLPAGAGAFRHDAFFDDHRHGDGYCHDFAGGGNSSADRTDDGDDGGFRKFMFEHVYAAPPLIPDQERAYRLVQELCKYYLEYPERLPHSSEHQAWRSSIMLPGLTDDYAIRLV